MDGKTLWQRINAANDRLAEKATNAFGTMWMFYAFFLYGLIPLIHRFAPYQSQIFYWSGWVQLWALPLILVGSIVIGRAAEKRAKQDHETIMREFALTKQMQAELKEILARECPLGATPGNACGPKATL